MLPTAGLFLPETLHRQKRPVPNQAPMDAARLKYFQRTSNQPKNEVRVADTYKHLTPDAASTENINVFQSVTTTFQFAEFVSSSSKASSEAQGIATLIHHVRQDLNEASRLYLSFAVSNFLEAWPDKKSWIDGILLHIRRSLNDIGSYIETIRVARNDEGVTGLKRRFEWISGHLKRLSYQQQTLSTCHQSLINAINIMQTVELCGVNNGTLQDTIFEAPVQPWLRGDDALVLRGPYSRREYRLSQKNLSLSSMYLAEGDADNIESTCTSLIRSN
jgi:hypothetical protein